MVRVVLPVIGGTNPQDRQVRARAATDAPLAPASPGPYIDRMADADDYVNSLEAQMLADYVSGGMPLAQACRTLDVNLMTTYDRMSKWPAFAEMMNKARDAGYDMIAVDCLQIADDKSRDATDREFVQRSKLRVETRLKLLAKWHPKKYGEKIEIEQKSANVAIPVGNDPIAAQRAYEQLLKG